MTSARARLVRGVHVDAPAKLNLLLHVLAREGGGFHSLETLFIKLALCDRVRIRTDVTDRSVTCDGPAMPAAGLGAPEDNLAWRAAVRFTECVGWPTGFAMHIDKHIPVGGGLGGGSADAAAVLRGLNAIAPTPLAQPALMELAGELGSDVPFLASDELLAWGWSRGDRLLGLPALPTMAVRLVTFADGVNTAAAYGALARQRESSRAARSAHYDAAAFSTWESIARLAENDFEQVVPALHTGVARWLPLVRRAAKALREQGAVCIGLMSGSGATCFLLHAPTSGTDWPAMADGERLVETRTAGAIVAPVPIV